MSFIRLLVLAWTVLALQSAAAGGVYRCKAKGGGTYYTDKDCATGDADAVSTGRVNMTVVDIPGKGGNRAPAHGKGKKAAGAPQYKTQNRYTRRAEGGAAAADKRNRK